MVACGLALFAVLSILSSAGADETDLLGHPAPGFTGALIDGTKVELAAFKDQKVVVLDFWATWCPPCRISMPILERVTKAYKDKGVVFYAVNQGESAETVKAYLEKTGLSFPVVLDSEGEIGHKYGVTGIPKTVIVGKDGTVQAIHLGVGRDLEAQLNAELDKLAAGKRLVRPELTPEPISKP